MSKRRVALVCTLDYVEDALDAERRLRKGDRQLFCPTCRLWRWPEQCEHKGRITAKEFDRVAKQKPRKKR